MIDRELEQSIKDAAASTKHSFDELKLAFEMANNAFTRSTHSTEDLADLFKKWDRKRYGRWLPVVKCYRFVIDIPFALSDRFILLFRKAFPRRRDPFTITGPTYHQKGEIVVMKNNWGDPGRHKLTVLSQTQSTITLRDYVWYDIFFNAWHRAARRIKQVVS